MEDKHLRLVDIFVHEDDKNPVLDITLYNRGNQVVLPTRAKIEILDVGEFYDCDDGQARSFNAVSRAYGVVLSPNSRGHEQVVKISHLLRPEESDRFQLVISQHIDNPELVYVWYRLKVTIVYDEQAHNITSQPLLLSIPPVNPRTYDIWSMGDDTCIAKNKATLSRMATQVADRSRSVEAAIQFCQANASGSEKRVTEQAYNRGPALPRANASTPAGYHHNTHISQPLAPSIDNRVEIFFSYAQEDEQLAEKLNEQLITLRSLITHWHAGKIALGRVVHQEIRDHLRRAHIIILLISPSFLKSQQEVISALEQGNMHKGIVVPVLLRPTANLKSTFFGKLQVIPRNERPITTWPNKDTAFAHVAEEIVKIVEALKRQEGS
jgi:TIR domain